MWKSVAAGILAADFITAAVHWGEDTYLPYDQTDSMLGQIARDNEMHHFVPYAITVESWWSNVKISLQLLAGVALALVVAAPKWASKNRVFLMTAAAAMAITNLLHRFQHERDCTRPALATWLQRLGILCSREQHAVHHRDSVSNYSVLLGFTNPIYGCGGSSSASSDSSACNPRARRAWTLTRTFATTGSATTWPATAPNRSTKAGSRNITADSRRRTSRGTCERVTNRAVL
jgi:hypothetical protein